ncbi:NAD(P)/FAD-dependent oxidoreductase [Paeniglutamicibacter psychrophenolicus]|uniref:NAD(P)/FAD-dependent oxidoreductase n=1 Tax=Paeniglutamicibacter psychrophenolicus TaxID=257454 RepID=UPI0027870EC4|nr:FAD/NAD(P)-binding oxidoreductase [Paeniglutamicibacter psychrophenolicus]MDQ0094510.1 sulfide:quinone oxidoreductase [Paeniglutamicibacter psychrophenolicus]
MSTQVLVLGAGFGGLEVAAGLSERFGADIEVTLIDRSEHFMFGFSKLDVMFGRLTEAEASHPYSQLDKPGVKHVRAAIVSIDPVAKRVETDSGSFEADYLVVALGADLDPSATPGLLECGHEYYSVAGALAARQALNDFDGGRVVIGVTSTPFKCPPAPSETAFLVHDLLVSRGLRERSEIALVMPLRTPVPPVPAASEALIAAFAERGIAWHPQKVIERLEPASRELVMDDGTTMPFDLFLGVPRHVVPQVVAESGMAVEGWIPVDPLTLQTSYPDVFAIGDVTSVGTPKAGIFAEGQGVVVVDAIAARINRSAGTLGYDGNGVCYVAFGPHRAARLNITFAAGARPHGSYDAASETIAQEKKDYGISRLRRWFGGE